jgi:hypothetical protein
MTQPKTASKFTPGPWTPERHSGGELIIRGKNSEWVDPQAPNNIGLTVKAPEMYELLDHLDSYSSWLNTPELRDIQTEARRIKAAIDGEG